MKSKIMKKKLQKLSIHFSLILFLTSKFLRIKILIWRREWSSSWRWFNNLYTGKIPKPSKYHSSRKFGSWKQARWWFEKNNKSLDISKTFQNSDVPTKIIKENAELFTNFIHSALNEATQSGNFPSCLKSTDVTPSF